MPAAVATPLYRATIDLPALAKDYFATLARHGKVIFTPGDTEATLDIAAPTGGTDGQVLALVHDLGRTALFLTRVNIDPAIPVDDGTYRIFVPLPHEVEIFFSLLTGAAQVQFADPGRLTGPVTIVIDDVESEREFGRLLADIEHEIGCYSPDDLTFTVLD